MHDLKKHMDDIYDQLIISMITTYLMENGMNTLSDEKQPNFSETVRTYISDCMNKIRYDIVNSFGYIAYFETKEDYQIIYRIINELNLKIQLLYEDIMNRLNDSE